MIISISLFLIAIGIQKTQKEDESITITQKTKKVKFADDDVEDYEIVDQKPKELDKENKSSLSELKNEPQKQKVRNLSKQFSHSIFDYYVQCTDILYR